MCVYIQKEIFDEDLAIALIDSSTVEEIATKLIVLNLDYENALDVLSLIVKPTESDMVNICEISKELASYRKALQILVG